MERVGLCKEHMQALGAHASQPLRRERAPRRDQEGRHKTRDQERDASTMQEVGRIKEEEEGRHRKQEQKEPGGASWDRRSISKQGRVDTEGQEENNEGRT